MENIENKTRLDRLQTFVDKEADKQYRFKVRFSKYDARSPPYILEARKKNKTVSTLIDDVNNYGMTKSFGSISNIVEKLTERLERDIKSRMEISRNP